MSFRILSAFFWKHTENRGSLWLALAGVGLAVAAVWSGCLPHHLRQDPHREKWPRTRC